MNNKIVVKNWSIIEQTHLYPCKNTPARRVHLTGIVPSPYSGFVMTITSQPISHLIFNGDLKMFEVITLNATYLISPDEISREYKGYFIDFLRSFNTLV